MRVISHGAGLLLEQDEEEQTMSAQHLVRETGSVKDWYYLAGYGWLTKQSAESCLPRDAEGVVDCYRSPNENGRPRPTARATLRLFLPKTVEEIQAGAGLHDSPDCLGSAIMQIPLNV